MESVFHGSDEDYFYHLDRQSEPVYVNELHSIGNDTRFYLPNGLLAGLSYDRDEQFTAGGTPKHIAIGGAYIQKSWDVNSLNLIPAVRWDQHSQFGNVFTPRFTASWRWSEAWKLSGNVSRSFRTPSFQELFFVSTTFTPNPDLKPETAWTYDLGVTHVVSPNHRRSVTVFYTRLKDRIASNTSTNFNSPRAEMSGVEYESEVRLANWIGRSNYTYQRAIGNSSTSADYQSLRLTPRHMANISATWLAPRNWQLTNTLQYVDKQFEFDDNTGRKLPSHTLWNARLAKKVLAAELYAAVDNITDKHYAESFGFGTLNPLPGRTYWGGVTIRFQD